MKLFLLAFSLLPISFTSIDKTSDSPHLARLVCKSADVTFQDGNGYMFDICGIERDLKYIPKGIGGFMGDEKAMVVSGFPSALNGRSIIIRPNTFLRLTRRGRTAPAFRSRLVVAGKYTIQRGRMTLKLGDPGR